MGIHQITEALMKAKATLLSVLLFCTTWVIAQTTSPSSTGQTSTSSGTTSSTSQTSPTPQTGSSQSASNPQTGTTSKTVTTMTQTVTTSTPSQAGSAASQTGASANQTGANPSEVGVTGNQNKIKGCLGGSAATGIYTLTDSQTGATYTLIGNTDKLRTHVGEEVEITGQGNSAGASTSGPSSGSSSAMGSGMGSSNPVNSARSGSNPDQTGNVSGNQAGNVNGKTQAKIAGSSASGTGNRFEVSDVTKLSDHCPAPGSKPSAKLGRSQSTSTRGAKTEIVENSAPASETMLAGQTAGSSI